MHEDRTATGKESRDHASEKSDQFAQTDEDKEALEMISPGEANAPTPAAPPMKDGGTRAWLQVAGSFLVFGKYVKSITASFQRTSY
jgi:hypothetical protein